MSYENIIEASFALFSRKVELKTYSEAYSWIKKHPPWFLAIFWTKRQSFIVKVEASFNVITLPF